MLALADPLPDGWHEILGETGRSALMWSLASMRPPGRATLLVQCAEPYDYQAVATWAGLENVLVLEAREDILGVASELCRSGDIGQVIFEGLGFLLGSGKMLPEVEKLLGDVSGFAVLTGLARKQGIAYYVSGQSSSGPPGPPGTGRDRPLGGRLLAELCVERRLFLKRTCFLSRHGLRIGERYECVNLLTGEATTYDLKYEKGPVKER